MTGLDDVVINELVRDSTVCWRLIVDTIVKMATLVNKDDLPHSPKKGHDTRVTVARGGKYTL